MTPLGVRAVLRGIAVVVAALCFAGAGVAVVAGVAFLALQPLALGVLIVVGVLFERWRYKPSVQAAGADFVATEERFIDADTGRPVRVWVDPKSGERRYVEG